MGFLSNIRSLFFVEDPLPTQGVEQRSGDLSTSEWRWWENDIQAVTPSGVVVTRDNALSVPAVWDAVSKVSRTLASLPFGIFEQTSEGSAPAARHPAYNLVRIQPTPNLKLYSSFDFRSALFAQACFGDAFAKVHRNGIGRPTDLELLDAASVTPFRSNSGRVFYLVRRQVGNEYREETLDSQNVLHIKGLTLDGMHGKPVVSTHKDSISTSISAERFGNNWFSNGATPSGALVFPQELKKDQRDNAERKIAGKFGGAKNTGKIMVLDAGVKFEPFTSDPQKSMLNETRNFQVNQAARIFGVPVPLLAQLDKATLNNMETMSIQFVTLCLRPWAVQTEQEFAIKLLTNDELLNERYYFRFNFTALLRGDTKSRGQYYKDALGGPSTGIGYMSVDEVRELENLDKLPNGEGATVFTAEMLIKAQNNSANGDADADTNDDTEDATQEAGNA